MFSLAQYAFPLLLASSSLSAPAGSSSASISGTSVSIASSPGQTAGFASDNANNLEWSVDASGVHQPIRGTLGATIIAQTNNPIVQQNPDIVAPPATDVGTVGQAKWPMSLSHNRLQTGGWARQQNTAVLPIAVDLAGVDMRLEAGSIRELHWHDTDEWAFVLKGSTQVTAITPTGENFIATVKAGDLWYFPAGFPHSLQATADDPDGSEFLLVFDNGAFSEDNTFLLTNWLSQIPKDVLADNFGVAESAFNSIPGTQLYIFPGVPPPDDQQNPVSPQGTSNTSFTFALSEMDATVVPGGTVKIVDSTVFSAAQNVAAALVTVEPGAMRELHWHPTQDEWSYFIEGQARVTLFASGENSRTFDFQAGDVGYVPATFGHYVKNVGNSTLTYLEIFKTNIFQDVSLSQWLALIPPNLVQAHLGISTETISHFSKTKQIVVAPNPNNSP
ncbi:oxalate decarboxylase [Pluteus cervinus]|uniref:Oxalate decarboxylase n=1 Tax=Pluteus cervinus TaxID=181527 RepID=A0ACD3ATK7_9AGAR|nr:oxalate decarboxylase [Pluteus cervinus]